MATMPRKVKANRAPFPLFSVEAECECLDKSVPEAEARNLATWLNYQLSKWLVRTGRRGRWSISAVIARK